MLASICSKCASSERSDLDESISLQLLLGFPSLIAVLAHENRVCIQLCSYYLWLAIYELASSILLATAHLFSILCLFSYTVGYKVICY